MMKTHHLLLAHTLICRNQQNRNTAESDRLATLGGVFCVMDLLIIKRHKELSRFPLPRFYIVPTL